MNIKSNLSKIMILGLIGCFALGCLIFPTKAEANITKNVEFVEPMDFGYGYETLDGTVRGNCVLFEKKEESKTTGQKKDIDFKQITNSREFNEELGLSISASYDAAFASASFKGDYLKKNKINQYAVTFVGSAKITNGSTSIRDPRLTAEMALLAKSDIAGFREKCGNSFIVSIATGGEFYGFISVESSSKEEQENITAALKVKSGFFSASANLTKKQKEVLSSMNVMAKVIQQGGDDEVPMELKGMIKTLKNYPKSIRKVNVFYKSTLQDYRTLPNYPTASKRTANESVLKKLVEHAWSYKSIIENIGYINSHKEEFYSLNPSNLKNLKKIINKDLDLIEKTGRTCRKDAAIECRMPKLTDPDDYLDRLPVRYKGNCSNRTVKDFELRMFPLDHTRGDAEMKGHNPSIKINVNLVKRGKALVLKGSVTMKEDRKDWTTFKSTFDNIEVFNLSDEVNGTSHCLFSGTGASKIQGNLTASGGKNNHREETYISGQGLIKSAKCISDSKGNDSGKLGCKSIILTPITITLINEEKLTPPKKAKNRKKRMNRGAVKFGR